MKAFIYIRDNEAYLRGDFDFAFDVFADKELPERIRPEYIFVQEIDIEPVEILDVTQAAVTSLDEEITNTRAEFQNRISKLEERKQNLLAITHESAA